MCYEQQGTEALRDAINRLQSHRELVEEPKSHPCSPTDAALSRPSGKELTRNLGELGSGEVRSPQSLTKASLPLPQPYLCMAGREEKSPL